MWCVDQRKLNKETKITKNNEKNTEKNSEKKEENEEI